MSLKVKFFSEGLTNNGFKYKLGRNVDTNPFDKNPTCGAGLYYTDIANMGEYTNYGPILGFVTIPDNVPIVNVGGTKYKSPEIFITKFINFTDWINDYNLDLVEKSHIKDVTLILRTMENPSDAEKLAAVTQNGMSIKYIKDPSEEVQLAAVKQNGCSIKYIDDPSDEVQLAAVNKNGFSIKFIKDPNEVVQLTAVKKHGSSIEDIKDPSEVVKLTAVTQYGESIRFIKDPSEEVQLAAVRQCKCSILFIINPTENVKMEDFGYK